MSIQELTEQLAEIHQKVRVRDKADRDLDHVRESLQEEYRRRHGLADSLKKESRDVERMEGISLTGLVYEFLGSKEEHLDKERREQLAAKLKLDQCSHVISELEKELSRLESSLSVLHGLDEQIELLLKEKGELLLQSNSPDAQKLLALAEETGTLEASQNELLEAIKAGESIRTSMSRVIDALNRALCSTNGNPISVWREHSRIDEARFHIRLARANANRFVRELGVIDPKMDAAIECGPLIKFTEYAFNNPITEWILGWRISESLSYARSAHIQVDHCLVDLHRRLADTQHRIAETTEQRRNIIERA